MINADTVEPWPQPLDDFDSRDLAMLYLRSNPESRWGMWYLLFKRPLSSYAKTLCIGTCGFKGPPSLEGSVEIGYWIVDRYQARTWPRKRSAPSSPTHSRILGCSV